jgi:hypothetical protein
MKFKQLPIIAKIAIVLTFFNTWVMFEEFVIDRFGYWEYLPFYKKGIFCLWDIIFISIAAISIFANWKAIKNKCFIQNCVLCKSK